MSALRWWALLALVVVFAPGRSDAAPSVRLTDVIRSTGIGTIDLFEDVGAAELEAFRAESSGVLLFAVDVNEAASGTEKASSQAVAIDTARLDVTIGGTVRSYTLYSTDTQALLARTGTILRAPYYTLIGSTGVGRGASNATQEAFDAVIRMPVPDNLAAATAAVLHVRLLAVNTTLGDPEAFYDFSNGFEAVSLVNAEDAQYITELAPGQQEAPAVIPIAPAPSVVDAWLSYPTADEFYTVAYEDQFPSRGDYDFNDLVASYRVDVGVDEQLRVVRLKGTAFLLARGAGYTHDWHLRIRATGASGALTVRMTDPDTLAITTTTTRFAGDVGVLAFADTSKHLPPQPGAPFTNTEPGSEFVVSSRVDFDVVFDASVSQANLGDAPFDPFLEVRGGGYEIHLIGEPPRPQSRNAAEGLVSFKNGDGYPFAMLLPVNWSYPLSGVDLGLAYPELLDWVRSNELQSLDWYTRPVQNKVRSYRLDDWIWVPPSG